MERKLQNEVNDWITCFEVNNWKLDYLLWPVNV